MVTAQSAPSAPVAVAATLPGSLRLVVAVVNPLRLMVALAAPVAVVGPLRLILVAVVGRAAMAL